MFLSRDLDNYYHKPYLVAGFSLADLANDCLNAHLNRGFISLTSSNFEDISTPLTIRVSAATQLVSALLNSPVLRGFAVLAGDFAPYAVENYRKEMGTDGYVSNAEEAVKFATCLQRMRDRE